MQSLKRTKASKQQLNDAHDERTRKGGQKVITSHRPFFKVNYSILNLTGGHEQWQLRASAVKELRERTGAGMLDCKKALEEANGDIDKSDRNLREKGLSAAANKAGRIATEGTSRILHPRWRPYRRTR